jgi:hypothetical protein
MKNVSGQQKVTASRSLGSFSALAQGGSIDPSDKIDGIAPTLDTVRLDDLPANSAASNEPLLRIKPRGKLQTKLQVKS